jgi:hypothetical protein
MHTIGWQIMAEKRARCSDAAVDSCSFVGPTYMSSFCHGHLPAVAFLPVARQQCVVAYTCKRKTTHSTSGNWPGWNDVMCVFVFVGWLQEYPAGDMSDEQHNLINTMKKLLACAAELGGGGPVRLQGLLQEYTRIYYQARHSSNLTHMA